ncbi:hypothetical protein N7495_009237 [Penicillium taxi]|uniref:uncharacterized protein n=1 Tax=Penicillium taxi TaxID=168475 RepID=UPI002544E283|nr:uncharacterized protein N7495_009237 [Penicillium taxi]KAJ5884727.1 hypothetical protein N7495_009237 [Penicillium taxi]
MSGPREDRIRDLCDDLDLRKFIHNDLVLNRPDDKQGIKEAADSIKETETELASLLAPTPPTLTTSPTAEPKSAFASYTSFNGAGDTPRSNTTESSHSSKTQDPSTLSPQQSPFHIPNEKLEEGNHVSRKRAREDTTSPMPQTQRTRLNNGMSDWTSYRERRESLSLTPQPEQMKWDDDYESHPAIRKLEKELKTSLVELRANFSDLREPENVALTMEIENQSEEQVLQAIREEQSENEQVIKAKFQIAKDLAIARILQERPDSEDEQESPQPYARPQNLMRSTPPIRQNWMDPTSANIPWTAFSTPATGYTTPGYPVTPYMSNTVDLTGEQTSPYVSNTANLTEEQAFKRLVQAMENDDGDDDVRQYESQHFPKDIKTLLEGITDIRKAMEHDHEIPPTLEVKLMKHQRIGLAWMKAKEHSSHRGGVLGDDMGLGKTIQAIALMAALPATKPDEHPSLIVCPKALMDQWRLELARHMKTGYKFSVLIFHDKTRNTPWDELKRYDIVITTFGTLVAHYKAIEKADEMRLKLMRPSSEWKKVQDQAYMYGPKAKWHRIIIDEAQNIKNSSTKAAKACRRIQARYRWCLTGTPMMNGLKDYGSLIQFLKIRPYCYTDVFKENFIKKAANENVMKQMRILIKSTCLRRTKASKLDGQPILVLPEKLIETHFAVPVGAEKEFYQKLSDKSTREVEKLMERGILGKNFSYVLVLILRLRQACCHPLLIEGYEPEAHVLGLDEDDLMKNANLLSPTVVSRILDNEDTTFTCPVCMDTATNYIIYIPCGHSVCSECYVQISDPALLARLSEDGAEVMKCQNCRGPVDPTKITDADSFKHIHVNGGGKIERVVKEASKDEKKDAKKRIKDLEEVWVTSAKTDKTLEIIQNIERDGKGEKTLVFSQFTSMLDLLEIPIKREGLKYVRFDGTMNNEARNRAIQTFTDDPDCRIFLISMKAGNAGLNLTMANHVIMFDPFWNPYVELQAIDRCYRIGQTKKVFVHRILIQNSIEDRIIELQENKMELIEGALNEGGKYEVSSLSTREMAGLFGIKSFNF